MSTPGLIRNDIVAVGLLALIVFLIASIGTYTPADPVASESGWLSQIYQADQVVYPQNESFSNVCGTDRCVDLGVAVVCIGHRSLFLHHRINRARDFGVS